MSLKLQDIENGEKFILKPLGTVACILIKIGPIDPINPGGKIKVFHSRMNRFQEMSADKHVIRLVE